MKVKTFYESFCKGNISITNAITAELSKLTENAFRDVNIAFANEISMICDKFNINVYELINLTNQHPRVNLLQPGCGVGGHCIAVDPWFIISSAPNESELIKKAREVNIYKTKWIIEKSKNIFDKYAKEKSKKPKIGILGISFKPDIDDVRESPAILIMEKLIDDGYEIFPCDPNIIQYKKIKFII